MSFHLSHPKTDQCSPWKDILWDKRNSYKSPTYPIKNPTEQDLNPKYRVIFSIGFPIPSAWLHHPVTRSVQHLVQNIPRLVPENLTQKNTPVKTGQKNIVLGFQKLFGENSKK